MVLPNLRPDRDRHRCAARGQRAVQGFVLAVKMLDDCRPSKHDATATVQSRRRVRHNGIDIDSSSAARGSICAKGVSDCLAARESRFPESHLSHQEVSNGFTNARLARRFELWYLKW